MEKELEAEENEEDPEWIEFDPKKVSGHFFGRSIDNEKELREKAKQVKQRNL